MKKISVFLFCLCIAVQMPLFGDISLSFGEKDDQLGFFDPTKSEKDSEDMPVGPTSFRASSDKIWVLDGVKQRIVQLDHEGKILSNFKIPGEDKNIYFEDFALEKSPSGDIIGFWVVDSLSQSVLHVGIDGKLFGKIGEKGKNAGQFVQIDKVELGSSGKLFVSDLGRQIIGIFSPKGALIKEIPFPGGGFCLDSKENIYSIQLDSDKLQVMCRNGDGEILSKTPIDFGKYVNFTVWGLLGEESILISYLPPDQTTDQTLVKFNLKEKNLEVVETLSLGSMNRSLEIVSPELIWVGKTDLISQPKGPLVLTKISGKKK